MLLINIHRLCFVYMLVIVNVQIITKCINISNVRKLTWRMSTFTDNCLSLLCNCECTESANVDKLIICKHALANVNIDRVISVNVGNVELFI